MKVKELIAALQRFDEDVEVRMALPTGDYWRHVKAEEIDLVELGHCRSNSYLGDGALEVVPIVEWEEDDEEIDPMTTYQMVVLQ